MSKQVFFGRVGTATIDETLFVSSDTGATALSTAPTFEDAPAAVVNSGGYGYFVVKDASGAIRVWASDGKSAPKVLDPSATTASYSYASGLTAFTTAAGAPVVVFFGNTAPANKAPAYQMYIGSGGGEVRAVPGAVFTAGPPSVVSGNKAYFIGTTAAGSEVWATDGTTAVNLDPVAGPGFSYFAASSIVPYTGADGVASVAFFGRTGNSYQLYISNGTGGTGTRAVGPASTTLPISSLVTSGSNLFWTAIDANKNIQVFSSGGTTVTQLDPASLNGVVTTDTYFLPTALTPSPALGTGKLVFFAALTNGKGTQMFVTDGTSAGTKAVGQSFASVTGPSAQGELLAVGGRLFFIGTDTSNRSVVWSTDGTTLTKLDPAPGAVDSYGAPKELHGFTTAAGTPSLAFFGTSTVNGKTSYQLYVSDGTAGSGTVKVPGAVFSAPSSFIESGGRLLFLAFDATGHQQFWATDGKGVALQDPAAANSGSGTYSIVLSSAAFTQADGSAAVAFLARLSDASGKVQLFLSTGGVTTAVPGATFGYDAIFTTPAAMLTVNGSKAYFGAPDGNGADAAWVLNGTKVQELASGNAGAGYTAVAIPAATGYEIVAKDAAKADGTAGTTNYTFTVSRSGSTAAPANLSYTVTPGAGTAGSLFGSLSGTVSFGPGDSLATVSVPVKGATLTADTGFTVTLGAGTGVSAAAPAAITTAAASGTVIHNATLPPSYAIAATDAVKPEGNGGTTPFTFTVTRTGDTSAAATVGYAVTGTGAHPAAAADFAGGVLPSGTVGFAAGASTASLVIGVAGDTRPEPDAGFTVTLSAAAGSVTVPTATGTIQNDDRSGGELGFFNGTTGQSGTILMDVADAGGPDYLQGQYIYAGSDNLAISSSSPNVFIHTGSGMDAIQVASGRNVLDGGLGSNFMTGGSGTDTFFTDARAPGVVWNTLRNFDGGDAATLWGFVPGVSSYYWEASPAGAAGFEGATLRANIVGGAGRTGDGIDASITFTGMSVETARGLSISTGTQPAGSYLYIQAPS